MENKFELVFVNDKDLKLDNDPVGTQYLMMTVAGKYIIGTVHVDRNTGKKYISNSYYGYKYARLV